MTRKATIAKKSCLRAPAGILALSAALIFLLFGALSAGASARTSGRVSAHLTSTSFTTARAGNVKLIYKFSAKSVRFAYVLSRKQGASWRLVLSASKHGSFVGSRAMTVKQLFARKPVAMGQYRVKLSADANSVMLTFAVIGSSGGTNPPLRPVAPGAFSKTSPAKGATGQSRALSLSWSASSNATSYRYCIDTTNNNACEGSRVSTGSATSASISGLEAGTTYYWQIEAINASGTVAANNGAWFSFTVATPQPVACPPGYTGTYPACIAPPKCPPGFTGTYPACIAPPKCPPGYTGTYPACIPPPSCPPGYTGTYPACIPPFHSPIALPAWRHGQTWPLHRPTAVLAPATSKAVLVKH